MIREGKTVVGTMISEFGSPELMKILSSAGFDFVFIDTEHAPFSLETVNNMVRVGRAVGLTCIVRVPDIEYHLIARTLDAGAHGLMFPRIETREQLELAVRASKFPPWGERGYGVRGIITEYQPTTVEENIRFLNDDTVVVAQIEKRSAIENIDNILSVKGVDIALIGPNDLSISLGVPGQLDHPSMREAIQKVVDACRSRGIASGTHVRDMKNLLYWRDQGMRVLTFSTEAGMLLASAKEAVSQLRTKSLH
jgi:2-dehydro-3-deoxyglucarate aldolase/4-hydroxy-2-oxoheptanedioate aldolase